MKTEQWRWSMEKGWDGRSPSETSGLGRAAQVVLLFGGIGEIEAGRCFDVVRAAYPDAYLFGCTTAGEIHGKHVTDNTVVITAIAFEHTQVVLTHESIPNIHRSFAAGEQLVRSLDTPDLRHIFVLSEGLLVNGSELMRGINSAIPSGVTVSGGFAGDGNRLQHTSIWCNRVLGQPAVAALAFYGDRLQVGVAASAGWDPFGPDRLITKAKDNVLYELDGRSALSLYKQYLGEYAQTLPASGLLFPLALRLGEGQDCVMRAILAINEEEQSITFAGNVPEGSYVRLMHGNIERLIDSAHIAATASMERLGPSTPQFAIVVSCNGRRPVLKQRVEEEIEAVSAALGDQAVLTGLYSYGEIAPIVTGKQSELHNQTITITSFAEI